MLALSLLLLTLYESTSATWNQAQNNVIPIPIDRFSWPQIILMKAVTLAYTVMWWIGRFPIQYDIPLSHYFESDKRRMMEGNNLFSIFEESLFTVGYLIIHKQSVLNSGIPMEG